MEGLLDDDLDLTEMLGLDQDEPEPVVPAPGMVVDRRRKKVVCKHWLRGLCKKTHEQCDFLHRLEADRMPECW
eukprot:3058396-Prymnesium_polylepis.1